MSQLHPEDVTPDPSRVDAAQRSFASLSASLGPSLTVSKAQACMRPCPADGKPLIGRVPGISNAYIATGHNCWGILWGPFTGKVLTELIVDGTPSSSLDAFDPGRFTASHRRGGTRGRHAGNTPVGEVVNTHSAYYSNDQYTYGNIQTNLHGLS